MSSGQTVLVVGGAGYIGSHMVRSLLDSGAQVIVLDNLSTGHREMLAGGTFYEGDLGDEPLLNRIFSRHPIDAVMHFAAFSLVGQSVSQPITYYRNNVGKTVALLNEMVQHRVNRFIFSSTAAVYGEPEEVPITEDHPLSPTNPYGVTKVTVERILQDCEAAYGMCYMSLRYFNAAGAHESGQIGEMHEPESHLIPLVLGVATGKQDHIRIFGTDYPTPDGTCIRDYIHVSDLIQAHLLALGALMESEKSGIYNLGNSKGYSVRDVIELARRITGHPIPSVESDPRPGDPAVLIAGSDRIRRELGWHPAYEDLESMIRSAWKWHRRQGI